MKKETRDFWIFAIVFVLIYIASQLFSTAKGLADLLVVVGVLYLAYKLKG